MAQTGEIEYTEFIAGCMSFQHDYLNNMLPDSFSRLDLSGDGYLNTQELWLLLSMGSELSGLDKSKNFDA